MRRMSVSKWPLTWGAGGSHPQATSDPVEEGSRNKEEWATKDDKVEEKRKARKLRWADCNNEEEKENQGEHETEGDKEKEGERKKEEVRRDRDRGREDRRETAGSTDDAKRAWEGEESEPELEEEEKSGHVESEYEVKGERRGTQEAR